MPRWLWPAQTRVTLGGQKTQPKRMMQQRIYSHISDGIREISSGASWCGMLQVWDTFVGMQMASATQPKFILPQYHGELSCLDTHRSTYMDWATWWPQRGAQGLSLHPMHEPLMSHRAVPVTSSREVTPSPSANHGQTGDMSIPFASQDPHSLQSVQAAPGMRISGRMAKQDKRAFSS